MTVNAITLDNFRSYAHGEAAFHPGMNIIVGENAQGKTNLLEAVAYLSSASSHRARYDRELIRRGEERAALRAKITSRGRELTLEAELRQRTRRQLCSNGVKLRTAGELSGLLNTVLFCPEDLYLIREGAEARRRFLDRCICQLRPRYAQALTEYKRLYQHKTRILRDSGEHPGLLDALDDFSLRMAQCGAVIVHYRAHFIRRLGETAPSIHGDCSGGREKLALRYETVSTVTEPEGGVKAILPQLLAHQEAHREAEIAARACLSGPHKDDLAVDIDDSPAKSYASQGQTRTAVLALKLAAREIFYHDCGEWPVLLLDDVLSELDARRQEFVLNRITSGQVFITCCEEEKLARLREGKAFHVKHGRLEG
ncbi:MAG: DNA replication/repair protein RecF [Oscillospiraceae bacterium]